MPPPAPDGRLPLILRLYRALVRALAPKELRAQFGEEMEETFLLRLAGAHTRRAQARLLLREALHLPFARADVRGRPDDRPPVGAGLDALRIEAAGAARRLRKSPGFTLTSAAVLAAGITTCTLVFTLIDQAVLRPLPVDDPETLVDVLADRPGGNSFLGFSHLDIDAFDGETPYAVGVAAFTGFRSTLRAGEATVPVRADLVSEHYFDVVGVPAALGTTRFPPFRGFGSPPVAVLGHAFWVRQFGADPGLVGSTIELGGRSVDVIGVAQEGFSGTFIGFPTDLWLPLSATPLFARDFGEEDPFDKRWSAIGRLPAGGSPAAAQAGLNAVAEELERTYPEANRGLRVRVVPATGIDESLRAGVRGFLALVGVLALVVLLVACLNLGGVLLVRAMHRETEIATRVALGAGAGRILRLQALEVAWIVLLGLALAALAVARVGRVLGDYLSSLWGGLALEVALDWRAGAFAAAVAVASLALAVLLPSLHLLRRSPAAALRRRDAGSGRRLVQTALVTGQVALSAALVVITGLFVQATIRSATDDPGLDPDLTTVFRIAHEEGDEERRLAIQRQLVRELSDHPAITGGVSLSLQEPITLARSPGTVGIEGVDPPADQPGYVVDVKVVGARHLEVLGIALLGGRDFGASDDLEGERVAVVSQAFAERFWPGLDPLGRTLEVSGQPARVVGVAADARYIAQDVTPDPLVYLSMGGQGPRSVFAVARSTASPGEVVTAIRQVVSSIAPALPVAPRTARDILRAAALPQRVGAGLVGSMGIVTLLLAATGLYALFQFWVERRLRELGIRLALGDSRRNVVVRVLARGLAVVGSGTAVGLLLSGWAARVVEPLVIGGIDRGPTVPVTVTVLFLLVALAAIGAPAARAASVSPVETLRAD